MTWFHLKAFHFSSVLSDQIPCTPELFFLIFMPPLNSQRYYQTKFCLPSLHRLSPPLTPQLFRTFNPSLALPVSTPEVLPPTVAPLKSPLSFNFSAPQAGPILSLKYFSHTFTFFEVFTPYEFMQDNFIRFVLFWK